ncbi:transposase family protein [Orientia tsutsugamushi str. Sido]|nr:transposase family protein [Orientia tsutsugamushi str. Sido]
MARRYSYDLRMEIFKVVDEELSIVKACKIFNISRNTIYRWKHLKRETGDIKAKPYGPAKGYSNNVGNRYNQINFITCSTEMLISLN